LLTLSLLTDSHGPPFSQKHIFFLFWLQINHISTVNRLPVPSPICLRKKIQVQVKKTEQKKKEKVIEVTCWSMKSGTGPPFVSFFIKHPHTIFIHWNIFKNKQEVAALKLKQHFNNDRQCKYLKVVCTKCARTETKFQISMQPV
jgi:hypothetical protein